jgi:DNA polymerase-3 subunit delta'
MSRAAAKKRDDPVDEPDRLEGFSSPREVDRLFGHEAALAEFGEALHSGRLHHAWLLVGPEGVGKATLAYRLAREVLARGEEGTPQAPIPAEHPVFRKVAGLGHPNLLLIRRSWNDKTKRYSQWIGVDEVRRLRNFLGHSAGETGWRVVVVDRADDLNESSGNALLKALEEPPPRTLFFLIATAEGHIPVTIRSRCRALRVTGLAPEELERAVQAALERDEREVDAETLAVALDLSQGSVRRALELVTGEGIALHREIVGAFARLPEIDAEMMHKLAERLRGAMFGFGDSEQLRLFVSLLLGLMERMIREAATGEGAIGDEMELANRLVSRTTLPQWVEAWEAIGRAKADVASLNLDRGLFVLENFQRLQQTARGAPG